MENEQLKKEEIKDVSGGCSGFVGVCPSCRSTNVTLAEDATQGLRHMYCMECGYEWNFTKM